MAFFNNLFGRSPQEMEESGTVEYTYDAFSPGEQFPPQDSIERIAKYRRIKKLVDGKQLEVYARALKLLEGSPHQEQLAALYIAVNIADILSTKPADLLVGQPPVFDSGLTDDTPQQEAINSYAEENDLTQLIYESAYGNGYRGDAWIKVRYDYRQDFSALLRMGLPFPRGVEMEPIIEHVAADCVFPVTSSGNIKKFSEVVIAGVEWVVSSKKKIPYLSVERHLHGYIIYERYELQTFEGGVNTDYMYPVQLFQIKNKVGETKTVATKVDNLLVHHIPYKASDEHWQGKGTIENIEDILLAISDRITQIDYVLWKHTDPIMYGPEVGSEPLFRSGGRYIEVQEKQVVPGYMTWDSGLEGAFKELEALIAMAFQQSETPQWIFGSVLGAANEGGTGTSHTDGAAIRARFMPILAKVARIRMYYDRAIRDALYNAQLLDIAHGGKKFEAVYPTIHWKDSLPVNEKEMAEIMAIRTGDRPTLDVASAIKRLDDVDDMQAKVVIDKIADNLESEIGTVDANVFNEE